MKAIIITGATSGIGLETARLLARKDCTVLGIGHSPDRCRKAREDILRENPKARIEYFTADLLHLHEVSRVAAELTGYLNENCGGELSALINNAGCVRSRYMTTDEGYEHQFALNHLAGFTLTQALFPLLLKSKGRVIMMGSKSHKGIRMRWQDPMLCRNYNPLVAYKQSKLCNILFAKGLNDRYAAKGIRAYVVDPGLVKTDIGNKGTGGLVSLVWSLRKRFGVSAAVPAETAAFLCGQEKALPGLYYYLSKEKKYSRQVTGENAQRLFTLSERLCGIRYEKESPA